MSNIQANSRTAVSLAPFNQLNPPMELGELALSPPKGRQYVLRMPIRRYYTGWQLPESLYWCFPLVRVAAITQEHLKINHPFTYITVRSGPVESETDDEWHTDGFSTKITHLPEQNYIWSDVDSTEYATKKILFPYNFDPLRHNIHKYIQSLLVIGARHKQVCKPKTVYCLDPYVIHRRPPYAKGQRTFVRVSFTPIEIIDRNNTPNPLLPTQPTIRDGVEIRNKLEEYK